MKTTRVLTVLSFFFLTQSSYANLRHGSHRITRTEACGPSTCSSDEYCCNESCGICTPFGSMCIQEFCETGGREEPVTTTTTSGETCGSTECASDEYCCNYSCSMCAKKDGGVCIEMFCEDGGKQDPVQPNADDSLPSTNEEECGPVTCGDGEYCCNPSCGICTKIGGSCILMICEYATSDAPSFLPSDVPSLAPSSIPSLF
jgi:hypothetical protein